MEYKITGKKLKKVIRAKQNRFSDSEVYDVIYNFNTPNLIYVDSKSFSSNRPMPNSAILEKITMLCNISENKNDIKYSQDELEFIRSLEEMI